MATTYNVEDYWSKVGQLINERGENFVAGDDDPYYRYKRSKFLQKFLGSLDFDSKTVLEIGFGPGGNLREIATHFKPKQLLGVDISQTMVDLAGMNLQKFANVELKKIDGVTIPFADQSIDMSFSVAVVQHNSDEAMCRSLLREIVRVTKDTVVLMEDIGSIPTLGGRGTWVGRTLDVYREELAQANFRLSECRFLNTQVSRMWRTGVVQLHKMLFRNNHYQGDPISAAKEFLIGLPLPITSILDEIFGENRNLAQMIFHREK